MAADGTGSSGPYGPGIDARVRRVASRLSNAMTRRLPKRRGRRPTGTDSNPGPYARYSKRDLWVVGKIRDGYEVLSLPLLTVFLFHNRRFDKAYKLTWRRKFRLARQMYRNTKRVETGTSNRAHMAMAAKIFEIPAKTKGVIVEAGCWKGGTTANLSLVADIVGRDLIVYDSFEGLPAPSEGDRWANPLGEGAFRGDLEEVQANVARCGVIDRCAFRKGWFEDTVGGHTEPIVAAFIDVDHQASMHQCLLGLWPHLIDTGYLFVDEYVRLDYCALFFSERFWRTYFDRPPPGLMGAGSGIAIGQYFLGPYRSIPPMEEPRSIGWTRKDFYGEWDYFPDDAPVVPLRGGAGAAHGPDGWTTTTIPSHEQGQTQLAAKMMESEQSRQRLADRIEELAQTEEGRAQLAAQMPKLGDKLMESDAGRQRLEAHLERRAQTTEN